MLRTFLERFGEEEAKRFTRISFSNVSRISIVLPSPRRHCLHNVRFATEWFSPINYNNNGSTEETHSNGIIVRIRFCWFDLFWDLIELDWVRRVSASYGGSFVKLLIYLAGHDTTRSRKHQHPRLSGRRACTSVRRGLFF